MSKISLSEIRYKSSLLKHSKMQQSFMKEWCSGGKYSWSTENNILELEASQHLNILINLVIMTYSIFRNYKHLCS